MIKNTPKLEWTEGERNEMQLFLNHNKEEFPFGRRTSLTERKMLELWRKQFTIRRFYVKHENPIIFVSSQWQRQPEPNLYYLIYRWLITIFFTISLIFSIVDLRHLDQSASNRAKWLIYLTSWGFATCTFQTLLGAVMLTSVFLATRNRGTGSTAARDNKALKLYKIYWVANIIATDIAMGITIIYWTLIYDEKKMALDEMNIIVHIFNSIFMLIDLLVVAHPIRILHFYWPVLYGVLYVLFSIIYYAAGGTNKEGTHFIYPILDWSKPGMTTVICVLVTLFVIFLHCLSYGTYYLRKTVHARLMVTKDKQVMKKEADGKEVYNNPVLSSDVV